MRYTPYFVMVTALGFVVVHTTAAAEFCVAHPLSVNCEHPPTLPDEQGPKAPFGSANMRTLVTAGSTVAMPPTAVIQL